MTIADWVTILSHIYACQEQLKKQRQFPFTYVGDNLITTVDPWDFDCSYILPIINDISPNQKNEKTSSYTLRHKNGRFSQNDIKLFNVTNTHGKIEGIEDRLKLTVFIESWCFWIIKVYDLYNNKNILKILEKIVCSPNKITEVKEKYRRWWTDHRRIKTNVYGGSKMHLEAINFYYNKDCNFYFSPYYNSNFGKTSKFLIMKNFLIRNGYFEKIRNNNIMDVNDKNSDIVTIYDDDIKLDTSFDVTSKIRLADYRYCRRVIIEPCKLVLNVIPTLPFEKIRKLLKHIDYDIFIRKTINHEYVITARHYCKNVVDTKIFKNVCGIDPGVKFFMSIFDPDSKERSLQIGRHMGGLDKSLKEENIVQKEINRSRRRKNKKKKLEKLKDLILLRRKEAIANLHIVLANYLVSIYDVIVIGNMRPDNISSQKRQIYKILRCFDYDSFLKVLYQVANTKNCYVITVDEYKSSKICGKCKSTNIRINKQRLVHCNDCGIKTDRDINAAENLLFKEIIKLN